MKHYKVIISILLTLSICACRKVNIPLAAPIPDPKPIFHLFDGQLGISDNSAIVTYDNNIVICGNLDKQVLVFKISKSGDLIWKKLINPGRGSVASGIAETKDHDLVICGHTDINHAQSATDIMLIKMSGNGDSIWTKSYGRPGTDTAYNIISTTDGNLLIAAKTENVGIYGQDLYLLKITTDGNQLWAKQFVDEGEEVPLHLMETKSGGYLVSGTDDDYTAEFFGSLSLLKVNYQGGLLWQKTAMINILGCTTVECDNGDIVTCCESAFSNNVLVYKTNNVGDMLLQQEVTSESFAFIKAFSMQQNVDHSYAVTGFFKPSPNARKIVLFMKIDDKGKLLLERKFGDPIDNEGRILLKDTNGDNLIIGKNDRQVFLTRLSPNGTFK